MRLLHAGYRPIPVGHRLPEDLDLDGRADPRAQGARKRSDRLNRASALTDEADIFAVVGTSLNVYPAAGLIHDLRPGTPAFLIDPNEVALPSKSHFTVIRAGAGHGMELLREKLLDLFPAPDPRQR